jgi:hypothetical protein
MKRLIFALWPAFLVGLFAVSVFFAHAHANYISSDQTQLMAQGSYHTVPSHRDQRDNRDFDRSYDQYYHDYYYPYYYSYPYTYRHGDYCSVNPGLCVSAF